MARHKRIFSKNWYKIERAQERSCEKTLSQMRKDAHKKGIKLTKLLESLTTRRTLSRLGKHWKDTEQNTPRLEDTSDQRKGSLVDGCPKHRYRNWFWPAESDYLTMSHRARGVKLVNKITDYMDRGIKVRGFTVAFKGGSFKFLRYLIDSCEELGIGLMLFKYGPKDKNGRYTLVPIYFSGC